MLLLLDLLVSLQVLDPDVPIELVIFHHLEVIYELTLF